MSNEILPDPAATGERFVDRIAGEKDRSWRPETFLDFSHLNSDVRWHLSRVYLLLLFTYVATWPLSLFYLTPPSLAVSLRVPWAPTWRRSSRRRGSCRSCCHCLCFLS